MRVFVAMTAVIVLAGCSAAPSATTTAAAASTDPSSPTTASATSVPTDSRATTTTNAAAPSSTRTTRARPDRPDWLPKDVEVQLGPRMALYTLPADLLFDTGEAELRARSASVVEEVARDIAERFAGRPLIVRGHTDSVGGSPANRELSRLRAEAVADILVEEGGIAPDSIEIEAYGELDPRASNETAEGRAQNRRVEILIRTRR